MIKEILKVGAACAVGSWVGGKVAPMLVNKFAPAGGLSETTVMLVDLGVSGIIGGIAYHVFKI